MKRFIQVSEEGVILQKAQGFEVPPFEGGVQVDTDDYTFDNSHRFKYIDGKFVEYIPPEPELPPIEERVVTLEVENTRLKAELEVTQAVVDELLFGGVVE